MNESSLVITGRSIKESQLIKAVGTAIDELQDYELKPEGVFGSTATVICGDVKIMSSELDLEFTVDFDDDMEANEAEILVYNLSDNTINQIKHNSRISIEAGFEGDTGLIFSGFVTKVFTKNDGADRVTTIKCIDEIEVNTVAEQTYAEGTKASAILKDLLQMTGTPIAVFSPRRDHTYDSEVKVDGSLTANIKKYSSVCGVSTFVRNGKIYSRYIKQGDNINLTLSEDTGLIGSPAPYEEEITAESYSDIVNGYECECIMQHRIAAGVIVNLKSLYANGTFRICSGSHRFNPDECITKMKMY